MMKKIRNWDPWTVENILRLLLMTELAFFGTLTKWLLEF